MSNATAGGRLSTFPVNGSLAETRLPPPHLCVSCSSPPRDCRAPSISDCYRRLLRDRTRCRSGPAFRPLYEEFVRFCSATPPLGKFAVGLAGQLCG